MTQVSQARSGPMPTTGRYGWYRDHEGNEFRRVSTMVKKVETDTYYLDLWMKRQVAEGLAIRDDLVLSLKAMGRPDPAIGWTREQKKKIDGIVADAEKAAKQRDGARSGTAYHDLTERVDRGEDIELVVRGLPAEAASTLRAYAFLRRENGWRNVEVERTVVCDELEVAGTFDRVDLVPGLADLLGPGECQYGPGHLCELTAWGGELPVIADVKTEENPTMNGLHIGPQLAIYSRAKRMWRATGGTVPLLDKDGKPKLYPNSGDPIMIPAGEYVPAPCVRQDVAIVVHLRDGRAEPLFVDLAEGWDAAKAAYAQINREARAKRKLGSAGAWFAEVPGVVRPRVAQTFVEQMVATQPAAIRPDVPVQHSLPGSLATAMVDASRGCNNCAPLVSGASMSRVDGTDETQTQCIDCGSTAGNPHAQVAVKDPVTGMVSWAPAASVTPEPPIGTQTEVGGIGFTKIDTVDNVVRHGGLDDVDRQAIEVIWDAKGLSDLAQTYDIYTGTVGRRWDGRVAEAAAARRRQIECPQRELHAGPGACACGWTTGIQP